jgi:hypothetical protein
LRSDGTARRPGRVRRVAVLVVSIVFGSVPLLVAVGVVLSWVRPVPPFVPPPAAVADSLAFSYDELFPYYLEYAAMTRIHRRGAEPGGRHGHAAFYLKGVRRVAGAPYPQLELAPEDASLSDPNTGVGVSVNKVLANVNWVAFDGCDLFYDGGMREGDVIDAGAAEAVVDRVLRSGAFDGVVVHDWVLADKPAGVSDERYLGGQSIGTDFALRFGRDVACVRIPVTREMMAEVVAYLNAMNRRYADDPKATFEWDGVENNCTHLALNALARVSGRRALKTDAGPVGRFFNLAIPANAFVDLAVAANGPVAGKGAVRAAFDEYGWLLQEPGVTVRFLPRFRDRNQLWEGDFDMYTMERPVVPLILVPPMEVVPIGSKWIWPPFYRFEQKAYRRLFAEPRYYDLRANLEHYLAVTAPAAGRARLDDDLEAYIGRMRRMAEEALGPRVSG